LPSWAIEGFCHRWEKVFGTILERNTSTLIFFFKKSEEAIFFLDAFTP
jgi:hypothetical protein